MKPEATSYEDQMQMIEDCEVREGQLTDWERKFIESLPEVIDKWGILTVKQAQTLEKIWDKVTS